MSAITAGVTAKTVQPEEPPAPQTPAETAYGEPPTAPAGEAPTI